MTDKVRYRARAYLSTPLSGFLEIGWRAVPHELLVARSPLGAARMGYWRLAAAERAACAYIVIVPFAPSDASPVPSYNGPEIAFSPASDWREHDPIV